MEEGRGRVRLREGLSIGEGEHVEGRAQYTGMPIAARRFSIGAQAGSLLRGPGDGAVGPGRWLGRIGLSWGIALCDFCGVRGLEMVDVVMASLLCRPGD